MQTLVLLEMALFFGGILAFCWWQMRLMRREIDDSNGSALARARPAPQAAVEKAEATAGTARPVAE